MHDHDHHSPSPSDPRGRRALTLALWGNAAFTVLQFAAGIIAGSVALIADAGHNLSDVAGLGIALWAAHLIDRPATSRRTFGYRRAEVLGALANALTVVFIAGLVAFAAIRRLGDPPEVPGLPIAAVAAAGILVNGLSVWLIHRTEHEHDLNLRAALIHLAADALASVGVLVGGLLIWWKGWELADPLVALLISAMIVAGTWGVLRAALSVLLESAPPNLDVDAVGAAMLEDPAVVGVHDLHVWSLSSDFAALSAHVLVPPGEDCHACRRRLGEMLEARFDLHHSTLQVEHESHRGLMPDTPPPDCHRPPTRG